MFMAWPCHCLVDGLSKKFINVYKKKVKLINHDCLPILMLLSVMLYIMLAYLMLFAAICNAVWLYNAFFPFFLQLIFANALCFLAFSWFIET